VFWGHLRETAAQDANDEPLCRVVISDITARKQAEEALIESERKLKEYSKSLELMVEDRTREINKALAETEDAFKKIDSILKSVGEGLLVTDIYSRIILMNRAAENLLDVRLSDVINRSLEFAIKDKTVLSRLKTTLSKDVNDIFDFELLKNGSNKPLFLHAKTAVIYDKSGKKTGVTISFHDVTFEREIDRIQNEFISTLAHELRTPLTSIRGFSEILLTRNNIPPSDQKKYLNYINNKSVEMANIINDLLNISRIESGPELELSKEMVNINEIISQLVRFYQDNSKKHSFEVFTSEKPVKIVVDGEKIKLVLKNILINSIKFSPDGGLIKIRGEITGDDYQVTIEDQGIGMTMDQVEQIFHKFYRADASNTALGGTGLGMNIVKNIVVMHGGKIWVNSQPGKGTAVKFTLPLACTE